MRIAEDLEGEQEGGDRDATQYQTRLTPANSKLGLCSKDALAKCIGRAVA